MSYADIIRRNLDPDGTGAFTDANDALNALVAENKQLRETVRLREESQIPMIPTGTQKKMERLEAEIQQQADRIAWLEGDVAGWRIKLADAEAEIKRLRDAA